ncbi:unnamed protein product [Closterium sp. NIES-54]
MGEAGRYLPHPSPPTTPVPPSPHPLSALPVLPLLQRDVGRYLLHLPPFQQRPFPSPASLSPSLPPHLPLPPFSPPCAVPAAAVLGRGGSCLDSLPSNHARSSPLPPMSPVSPQLPPTFPLPPPVPPNARLPPRPAAAVPSLLQLCVGEVGRYLPHLLCMDMDAHEFNLRGFVALLPPHARLALTAIARRRGLLFDWLLETLVDDTWHSVDLCGSDVSDQGLCHVAQTCPNLVALDIRECNAMSLHGLTLLLKACPALQLLRMGGSPACNKVARAAVKWMLPQQPVRGTEGAESAEAGEEEVEGEGETAQGEREGGEGGEGGWEGSWEEVEERLEERVPALRWLIWPDADPNSAALLASKCPRILLNPAPPSPPPPHSLPPPYCHIPTTLPSSDPSIPPNLPTSIPALPSALLSRIPLQAFPALPLDTPHLVGIPPAVWERGAGEDEEEGEGEEDGEECIRGEAEARGRRRGLAMGGARAKVKSGTEVPQEVQQEPEAPQLSIAERFRLAFVARDERLAPKRAKNQRQRERREGRDRAAADMALRARLLASAASRSLRL